MSEFDKKAEENIPAEIRMISGCKDEQTSADVGNVTSFGLPDPAGRAGGACTSAILKVLYADKKKPDEDLSFKDVLLKMRDVLDDKRFEQIPQLTSSRNLDVDTKFDITPDDFNGTKRAVLIGINYVGQSGELAGCQNDALNMMEYLKDVHDFKDENIQLLLDDGKNINPTKKNILKAYAKIAEESEAGDVVYLHYAGHGGHKSDKSGEEKDGRDETLIPVDFQRYRVGEILDDDIYQKLVLKLKKGVFATSVMDCCHSGTVLDLPYKFLGDGKQEGGMNANEGFNFAQELTKGCIIL